MNARVLAQPKLAAKSVVPPMQRNLVLQRRAADAEPVAAVPSIVHDVLNSSGQPLDRATRAFMEPRFGHDFGHVRVHTNATAVDSARAVHAHAYTVGQNVVFGANEFAPATHQGRELLAHELAHTIQQRNTSGVPVSICPDEALESNASAVARNAVSGGTVSRNIPASGLQIQRSPDKDPRWKNNVQAGRYRGQIMANRIKKHGLLSRDARAKINQELAYFEGDAKEAYLREVKPVLFQTVPIEMPAQRVEKKVPQPSITWSLVQPDPNRVSDEEIYAPITEAKRREEEEKKTGREYAAAREYGGELTKLQTEWEAEPEHTEQERERAGMEAYYLSTRQSQLEAAGAAHAKIQAEVWHMTPKEIYSQWESGKVDFVAVASSSVHTLKAEQLHQIWLRHWDDRFKHGETTRIRIAKSVADADYGDFYEKSTRYHNGERNALGSEFADAYDEEETARAMFRQSVWVMEYLRAADAHGRTVTLKEINERALLKDKLDAPIREGGMFLGAVGAPQSYGIGGGPRATSTVFTEGEAAETAAVAPPTPAPKPDVITPSRPVSGFARPLAPAPEPVPAPEPYVVTQTPRARVVQGNQPAYGSVTPVPDIPGQAPATTPSRRVQGFRPAPKDVAEKGHFIETEMGPREYVRKEHFGDVGTSGEAQSRYHVNIQLDANGMMDADFVLREGGKRSGSLFGKDEFLAAKQHFEQANGAASVKGAYGRWSGGDNLDTFNTRFNQWKGRGLSDEAAMTEAAKKTKTGEWASAAGFKNVKVTKAEGSPGAFTNVEVEFTK